LVAQTFHYIHTIMERFVHFCHRFADYPRLQKDLSLLDKPASNGTYALNAALSRPSSTDRHND